MKYFTVIFVGLLLTGCYSNTPLAPVEQAVFDEGLLGRWLFPGSGDDVTEIVVARFNENEYVAAPADEFSAKEGIRFYVTEIDGQRFLNAQNLDPDLEKRGFMFARYRFLNENEALLEIPRLDAVPHQVASSEELVEVFRTGGANADDFFNGKPSMVKRIARE